MEHTITIRPARAADARTIATAVAMAIGDEVALRSYCGEEYLAVLDAIARTQENQYSWQNALVAECNSEAAGAVVGYDGGRLEQLRAGTLAIINHHTGRTPRVSDETEAGEYYLDSVAVMPQFRGLGIGARLVEALCQKAFQAGHERVGLLVDVENPKAEELYTALGFVCVGERTFFGHQMRHLQRQK